MPRTLGPSRVIARFAVRLALLIGFAAFGSVGFSRSLAVLLWMSVILCALAGVIRREPAFKAALNHWDEAVAFGALFALAHIANELA
ncbi:hypothetical protein [Bradyrhizobium sp. 141]|uniref:hypothetical protein n=1 Tax=Bradyrhizobium sp. 141 TaxID=2782617 RepID=UPI001FFABCE3|nr:hypothetical protein [Bradyrhizobium sp. 141]